MKILRLMILLPLAAAVVALSVANRHDVSFNLAIGQYVVDLPLYFLLLATFFAGLLTGGFVATISRVKRWNKGRQTRRSAGAAPEAGIMSIGRPKSKSKSKQLVEAKSSQKEDQ